jgi:enamine deaminase RidA (YjgF/YER057c/UK114 family)
MQAYISAPVSNKFAELIHALNYAADDIKIACAEASLEGNFADVAKLSHIAKQLEAFIKDANELSNRWNKGILQPSAFKKQVLPNKKNIYGKKPRSKLSVAIADKQIQHDTAVNSFVAALETMGFERVASLGKKLSGVPLISKTPPTGYQSHKQHGPWFITTHSSTQNMKQLLEELGKQLKILIQVKILPNNFDKG